MRAILILALTLPLDPHGTGASVVRAGDYIGIVYYGFFTQHLNHKKVLGIAKHPTENKVVVYITEYEFASIDVRTDKNDEFYAFWKYLNDGSRSRVVSGCDLEWIPDEQAEEWLRAGSLKRRRLATPADVAAAARSATLARGSSSAHSPGKNAKSNVTAPQLKTAIKRWRDGDEGRKAQSLNYNDWKRSDLESLVEQHGIQLETASEPIQSAAGMLSTLPSSLVSTPEGVPMGVVSAASSIHTMIAGGASVSVGNSSHLGIQADVSVTTSSVVEASGHVEEDRREVDEGEGTRQTYHAPTIELSSKRRRGADDEFASFNFGAFFTAADKLSGVVPGVAALEKGLSLEKHIGDRSGKSKPDYVRRILSCLDFQTNDVLEALYAAFELNSNGAKVGTNSKARPEPSTWIKTVFIPNFVSKFSV